MEVTPGVFTTNSSRNSSLKLYENHQNRELKFMTNCLQPSNTQGHTECTATARVTLRQGSDRETSKKQGVDATTFEVPTIEHSYVILKDRAAVE